MSKDNITYQSLITQSKTGLSSIAQNISDNSLITNEITKNSLIGIEDTESPVTPLPPILEDGNSFGFFDYLDTDNMVIDGSGYLSEWNDKLGSLNKLVQVFGSSQALVDADGVYFEGLDDFIETNFINLDQPEFIYLVFRQRSWTNGDYIMDGDVNVSGAIRQTGTVNYIGVHAGLASPATPYPLDTFGIVRVLFNAAASKFIVNDETPIVGNWGTRNMDGITLGSRNGGFNCSEIQVKGLLVRKIADTSENEIAIYNYLKTYYGV